MEESIAVEVNIAEEENIEEEENIAVEENIVIEEVEEGKELYTYSVLLRTKRINQIIFNSQRESMMRRTTKAARKKITYIRRLEHEASSRKSFEID